MGKRRRFRECKGISQQIWREDRCESKEIRRDRRKVENQIKPKCRGV